MIFDKETQRTQKSNMECVLSAADTQILTWILD